MQNPTNLSSIVVLDNSYIVWFTSIRSILLVIHGRRFNFVLIPCGTYMSCLAPSVHPFSLKIMFMLDNSTHLPILEEGSSRQELAESLDHTYDLAVHFTSVEITQKDKEHLYRVKCLIRNLRKEVDCENQ